MKAAYITKYGMNEKLTIGEMNMPVVGDNDVLVEIYSASLNPIDFKVRDGKIKFIRSYSFPLILGHDLAGLVKAVGNKVKQFKVGDRVFSRPRNGRTGSLAQFIAIDESDVALMPKNLSFEEAASLPLVGLTSVQALLQVAGMKSGDRVFIQAGAGGVGSFAIQLAKSFGAHVITTTSSKNMAFVRELGADEVIDYKVQKFEEAIKNVDIVFDTLGGEDLYKSFRVVRPGGWVVSISGAPDQRTADDMQLGFIKKQVLRLVGHKANKLAAQAQAHYRFIFMNASGAHLAKIARLVEEGKIKPVIDSQYSFADVQKAMEHLEQGRSRGKVIVKIRE